MARKSAAALSVVAGGIDQRPNPPADLTQFQQELWRRVVAGEPSTFFKTAALQVLLGEFCRHTEAAHRLARAIDGFEADWLLTDLGLARYGELLKLRDRETKAAGDKATKLRLTNQSRYTPQAASTATRKTGEEKKPWQTPGDPRSA